MATTESHPQVGESSAYRARQIDDVVEVEVLKLGMQRPPRVLVRFVDERFEGRQEWSVITMQLDWIPVSESYGEADGALMPGLAFKQGVIARISDGAIFLEVWPSEPPEHLGDVATLTVDGVVVEEIGRFASYDESMAAAQTYFDDRNWQLPGAR